LFRCQSRKVRYFFLLEEVIVKRDWLFWENQPELAGQYQETDSQPNSRFADPSDSRTLISLDRGYFTRLITLAG
jgi:hypothetical protein